MRRWFEKTREVIIWAIAIAFVVGIALWSLTSYFYGRKQGNVKYTVNDAVAYLTKDGTALENSTYWVFPWEVETSYNQALSYYKISNIDPIFEEPMLKTSVLNDLLNTKLILYYSEANKIHPSKDEINAELKKQVDQINQNKQLVEYIKQKYGSVSNYEKQIEPDVEKYLTVNKVKETIGSVSEEEIKKYYEENKEALVQKYDNANVDYVYFTSDASAQKFIQDAMMIGFQQAATNMNVDVRNIAQFKRGFVPEEYERSIFSGTNTMVGPVPIGNSFFVFNVKDVKTVDTFEKFSLSSGYQDILNKLKTERFNSKIETFRNENNIDFVITDPVYKTWNLVLNTSGKDLIDVYKQLYETVFDGTSVNTQTPLEIQTAFITLVDKMRSATEITDDPNFNMVLLDAEKDAKKVIENVYNEYSSSFNAAKKMKEIHPENTKVLYNYYGLLYSRIKPYLEYGMMQNVVNDFIDLYNGFNTIANATDATLDMKAEVLYNLYEINKMLGDATTARVYLEKLQKATPDYMDYDSAYSELDTMLSSTSTENK
ncbi:peptidyl-prolyl cis-trans isomerase [Thermosipho ferrireducens]|uniref:peptidylprolyl isomerase n=1 Tax=Thermosipho ferrireducens TaxID=2571116 RepID=A0ABX7S4H2_9BACT|nr:peptidyl-prolyl cis-trans isomerase [Thermosipho ferrireducens]QTA37348.1 peptidyl-prolyl cis-trans isomerase [Thermosipho ferrireducens]